MDDKDTPEDISKDELLTKANVSHNVYVWTKDVRHRKQYCHAKKATRVLDQHL